VNQAMMYRVLDSSSMLLAKRHGTSISMRKLSTRAGSFSFSAVIRTRCLRMPA